MVLIITNKNKDVLDALKKRLLIINQKEEILK
jgi:hypothetical protein